ncbi:melanoma-associated antigen 9-like [Mirounga angustirostris]|uniref:melanoma-associated antigen 9-like n=1 Tax=Mirounga angustirostris TaxID=9716 RepID=UPI00313D67C8
MPLGQRGEFWELEEDPGPAQGLVEAQPSGAGEEEAPCAPSSSSTSASSQSTAPSVSCSALFLVPSGEGSAAGFQSPPQSSVSARPSPSAGAATPWSLSEDSSPSSNEEEPGPGLEPGVAQPLVQTTLHLKAVHLVAFLLLKYRTQQPTSQAEMLEIVGEDDQDAYPVLFGQASKCMQLVFGVDVKEVDPGDHSYILVPVLGLTWDGMLSGGQGLPKTSLLVLVLALILLEDDHALEEEVWEELGAMGVYAGQEHIIYGEPRELLTNVWVQEGYVEYRQVPGSDPARYEFLWGPRAHAETSRLQMTEYFLQLDVEEPASSLAVSEGAVRDEEDGA